ncbi:MAG: HPr family phosphocarrier protein [Clostridiaceae bacterium]|jgi:phosphocarrier protein HPr|nr:HPr family phosphocarrier protein [Clostridiaceae bacterium]
MYSKESVIINPSGLHARPAAEFVAEAKKYDAKIQIKRFDEKDAVNAKSIVMILSKAFAKGDVVQILADGNDEQVAVDSLVALINSGFSE